MNTNDHKHINNQTLPDKYKTYIGVPDNMINNVQNETIAVQIIRQNISPEPLKP